MRLDSLAVGICVFYADTREKAFDLADLELLTKQPFFVRFTLKCIPVNLLTSDPTKTKPLINRISSEYKPGKFFYTIKGSMPE